MGAALGRDLFEDLITKHAFYLDALNKDADKQIAFEALKKSFSDFNSSASIPSENQCELLTQVERLISNHSESAIPVTGEQESIDPFN